MPALGLDPGARVLAVAMAAEPILPELLRSGCAVVACDWSWGALEQARRGGLPPSAVVPWEDLEPPAVAGQPFDAALCDLGRIPGRAAFAMAVRCACMGLSPAGRLLVAGGHAEGVGGAATRLREWFGSAVPVGYAGGRRILEARPGPRRAPPPPTAEDVAAMVGGVRLRLRTVEGVFNRGLPDAAGDLLCGVLARRGLAAGRRRAADVGAGAGVLGLCALALGAERCALVEDNLVALAAARGNAARNGLGGRASMAPADARSGVPDGPYDLVVCNPPIHQGPREDREVGRALVRRAWEAVAAGGVLVVVAHRFLPYDRDVPELEEAEGMGAFRVWTARRP